jgi:hypothetical protein
VAQAQGTLQLVRKGPAFEQRILTHHSAVKGMKSRPRPSGKEGSFLIGVAARMTILSLSGLSRRYFPFLLKVKLADESAGVK